MKKALYYSLADLRDARLIQETATSTDRFGGWMWTPDNLAWASSVLSWWEKFRQVLRKYAKSLGSAAIAMKAIWDNLKGVSGRAYSIGHMLRDILRTPKTASKASYRYGSLTDPDKMGRLSQIRSRSAKWEVRSRRAATTSKQHETFNNPRV